MVNYIINNKTLAVMALNKSESLVHEEGRHIIAKKKPMQIVRRSCHVFGSTFQGRVEGAKNLTGYRYKLPIIIQEYDELVIFPIKSPCLDNNDWVCLNHIDKFYPNNANNTTFVKFDNGLVVEFKVSFISFKNQYVKASYLLAMIKRNM